MQLFYTPQFPGIPVHLSPAATMAPHIRIAIIEIKLEWIFEDIKQTLK